MLQKPVLYLSHYFRRYRQDYYELLQATRDRGAFEEWLKFFLTGVAVVSAEATDTARRILTLREQHRSAIADRLGYAAGNRHRVLEYLFEHSIVSVSEISDLIGITYAAANQLVARLVDLGLLVEITGQARNRRFRYDPISSYSKIVVQPVCERLIATDYVGVERAIFRDNTMMLFGGAQDVWEIEGDGVGRAPRRAADYHG